MSEEVRHPDGRIEHPSVRHERTDASFRAVVWALGIGLVLAVVIHLSIWWFFRRYGDYQNAIKRSNFPLAPTPSTQLPPQPRLEQIDRMEDVPGVSVAARQARREAVLDSYGPTTEEGFIRVPIERAMAFLAGKLPTRPVPPSGQGKRGNGLLDSGESNSGRILREEPKWSER